MAQTFDQAPPIPADLADGKPRRSTIKFLVGGSVLLGLVVLLAVQAVVTTGAYFLTVQEVLNAGLAFNNIGSFGAWGRRSLRADVTAVALSGANYEILWVGTADGRLLRSPDRGVNWR